MSHIFHRIPDLNFLVCRLFYRSKDCRVLRLLCLILKSPPISKAVFTRQGVLEPLTHSRADLRISKESLILNHVLTMEYKSFCLMASLFARRLISCSHYLPMPPFVPIISGVNVPCSISNTLCYIHRFFACSCSLFWYYGWCWSWSWHA